ncbi:peptide chain release factor N(5)-glutamine methyltransferase [Pedobacter frigiditerrae]|uniref:Release factor glutamine methyltransferase n=1 Tax=Pedobacter frigiditerrae TaxID=2530452 RepID=A0A4R0MT81_9SPHI|nr:peptide chain release factor N(5)-glutamine methyltransferase [Pedobacter frigiditerrae]TCC90245.1 peptide chain release factor N(5)-glutamine methyltransferase [Pedobacter frigiditerrae]
MQLKQLAQNFKESLSAIYQEDESQALFLVTLQYLLNYSRADYSLKKDLEIAEEQAAKFLAILKELKTGRPIQYILGEAHFYGFTFKVDESVLIPRPETEELVEWIIEEVKNYDLRFTNDAIVNRQSSIKNILDIGTGSGCIAISLKKNLPNANVYALDIAEDTIETAKKNAILNNVEVGFIKDDILQSQYSILNTQYSVIVSNPPYIKEDEKPAMHQNVVANEPHRALFVSNENPLIFYETIASFALKNLANNGLLFFEINEYLGEQTVNLLKDKGFKNIELKKDMQGKDRMIRASYNP